MLKRLKWPFLTVRTKVNHIKNEDGRDKLRVLILNDSLKDYKRVWKERVQKNVRFKVGLIQIWKYKLIEYRWLVTATKRKNIDSEQAASCLCCDLKLITVSRDLYYVVVPELI